jgi:mRNA-degrading endonuclease YafQ of YafQ-DinJ toxin-antitoxin module
MRGREDIWEMSVTMNRRITFQVDERVVVLRRIGTHDTLRQP